MTPAEAARLLAKIQAYDGRTVGRADVAAWAEALHDIEWADASDAVARYFRTFTDWIQPAHVRSLAREVRSARGKRRPIGTSPFLMGQASWERKSRFVQMCRDAISAPTEKAPERPQTRSEQIRARAVQRACAERRSRYADELPLRRLVSPALREIAMRRATANESASDGSERP